MAGRNFSDTADATDSARKSVFSLLRLLLLLCSG